MSNHLEKTFIEKNIRGWKRPSDHVPVVADFIFNLVFLDLRYMNYQYC